MYVADESGFVLREGAGRLFLKILVMGLNSIFLIEERIHIYENISGKNGQWVKVIRIKENLNTKIEGWCFDAFLGNKTLYT
jgi:hypothetical protein